MFINIIGCCVNIAFTGRLNFLQRKKRFSQTKYLHFLPTVKIFKCFKFEDICQHSWK